MGNIISQQRQRTSSQQEQCTNSQQEQCISSLQRQRTSDQCHCDGKCQQALSGLRLLDINPIELGPEILGECFTTPLMAAWDPFSKENPEILVSLLASYGNTQDAYNRYSRGSCEYWGGVVCHYDSKAEVCSALTNLSEEHPEYRGLSLETLVRTVADVEPTIKNTKNTRIVIKCYGRLKRDRVDRRLLWLEDRLTRLGAAMSFPVSLIMSDPDLLGVEYQAIFRHFTHAFCADLYLDGRKVSGFRLSVRIDTTMKTRAIMRQLGKRVRRHFESLSCGPQGTQPRPPRGAVDFGGAAS